MQKLLAVNIKKSIQLEIILKNNKINNKVESVK